MGQCHTAIRGPRLGADLRGASTPWPTSPVTVAGAPFGKQRHRAKSANDDGTRGGGPRVCRPGPRPGGGPRHRHGRRCSTATTAGRAQDRTQLQTKGVNFVPRLGGLHMVREVALQMNPPIQSEETTFSDGGCRILVRPGGGGLPHPPGLAPPPPEGPCRDLIHWAV